MKYLKKQCQTIHFKSIRLKHLWLILVLLIWAISVSPGYATSRGINVIAKTPSGETRTIPLYSSGYYALVIGAGDYKNGWPDLRNAVSDAEVVAEKFKGLGWEVRLLKNPDSEKLEDALNRIIVDQGKVKDKGVLIWFSGHGHTLKEADGSNLGYIVPVDAPLPSENEFQFMRTAIDMRKIETIARRIKSKHMLLVFDSCFSGSIFNINRAAPSPYIREKVAEPVRQIITAGDENEPVPDKSVFKTVFLQGVFDGYADRNTDGFVTGEELGAYMAENVINYSRGSQHPQYGKINHPKLDKGDFVFWVASSGAQTDTPAPRPSKTSLSITSNISGASVYLDGQQIGSAPIQHKTVDSGLHKIRVTKAGYEAYETSVTIGAGRHVTLDAVLEKEAPAAGNLYVNVRPSDAKIRILNIGPAYARGMALSSGDYHVEVSKDGYEIKNEWVAVSAGEDRYVTIVLKQSVSTFVAEGFSPPSSATVKKITNSLGMEFVYIEPGTFIMGSPPDEYERQDDEVQHRVLLTKGYYMQVTEVTQGQWISVMGSNPSGFSNCGGDCPVEQVTGEDAQEFIRKLNQREGHIVYRLPTEAEWEYACRAGKGTPFNKGSCISIYQANYNGNYPYPGCPKGQYRKAPIKVGSLSPNEWGLYDMHGNVWEYCQDCGEYPSATVTDPAGNGYERRGGGFADSARCCRSAFKGSRNIAARIDSIGFRIVMNPGQ